MKISAIIRYRNEEEWIGHAIQSFIDFFPKGEIVLVENNSTDTSKDVIRLFDRFDIKHLSISDYTPGRALNLGVENAKYDTILIQSAHTVIKSIDYKSLENNIDRHVAVFGNQIPIYMGKRITKRYVWSHFKEDAQIENFFSNAENRYFLHNAFCFYQKDILLKNKFDEKLHGKEDRYWAHDIVQKGYSYLYDSINLSSYHYYTKNGATWKGIG